MVATPAPDRTPPRPDGGAASQPPGRAAGVALGRSDVVLVSGGRGHVLAMADLLAGPARGSPWWAGLRRPAEVTAVDLALASLRRAGTVVSYATADISDPDQAEAAVARIEEQASPVTAVRHQSSSGRGPGAPRCPPARYAR